MLFKTTTIFHFWSSNSAQPSLTFLHPAKKKNCDCFHYHVFTCVEQQARVFNVWGPRHRLYDSSALHIVGGISYTPLPIVRIQWFLRNLLYIDLIAALHSRPRLRCTGRWVSLDIRVEMYQYQNLNRYRLVLSEYKKQVVFYHKKRVFIIKNKKIKNNPKSFFFVFLFFYIFLCTKQCFELFFTFFMVDYMKTTLNCPSHRLCYFW